MQLGSVLGVPLLFLCEVRTAIVLIHWEFPSPSVADSECAMPPQVDLTLLSPDFLLAE